MKMHKVFCVVAALLLVAEASAQTVVGGGPRGFVAHSNLIMPQSRVVRFAPPTPQPNPMVRITEVRGVVTITGSMAVTTLDVELENPANAVQEAELLLPVPAGAVIKGLDFKGAAKEPTARILPHDEARRLYDSIVAKTRDPALLEFAGLNLLRSSVFPVPARGEQTIRVVYETLCKRTGNRMEYVLPRSADLAYRVPWRISFSWQVKGGLATLYSPSHAIADERMSPQRIQGALTRAARTEPGSFVLCAVDKTGPISASLIACPEKGGGGYFMLLAGLPEKEESKDRIKRQITLVIDRSGSMAGDKIEQVREAARQVVAGLEDGERFNLIVYNDVVEKFSSQPVAKSAETEKAAARFIDAIRARGGTNIHDALLESMRAKPKDDALPMVLFLTDGLPTVGETSEVKIRDLVRKENPHRCRVFTFGVGNDVNTPLLEAVALDTRASPTFVAPEEEVELKVAQVYSKLDGPVLASPTLSAVEKNGDPRPGALLDLLPHELPDFFAGEQLVLLGRYTDGSKPLRLKLSGQAAGEERTFTFDFPMKEASRENTYVARLWASRKIAQMVDEIRRMGADPAAAERDPRFKELTEEIVRLSIEFGILTEYTAFLATEGTNLLGGADLAALRKEARRNLNERAVRVRWGKGAANQGMNMEVQRKQQVLNNRNDFFDAEMNRVEVTSVRQINDQAFFRQGKQWVDNRLIKQRTGTGRNDRIKPDRTVAVGTPEFHALVTELIAEKRQGVLTMPGEILLESGGKTVLITGINGIDREND
ncbi:MAG: VWA domain-containing protein [Lentisphaeria bacterium]|nr:VWA domain-containing protein [Lentisphaeria bacterium]